MLRALRRHIVEFCSSAGYLVLLLIGFEANDAEIWPYVMAAIAAVSLIAWAVNFSRGRLIADLPTSRIGSAAQGYTEIFGRASIEQDNLIRSPYSGLSCIWYRYWAYVREQDKWREVARGSSHSTFEISDGSGRCFVDPDGAEIIGPERRESRLADHKHVEEMLFAGPVYVLGDFVTVGGSGHDLSVKEDVSALLAEWKLKPAELKARFDLDGNGEIDLKEWELARRAAMREVEKQHREIRAQPDVHVMRAPKINRPYLISSMSPQKLRGQYLFWSYVHILILIFSAGACLTLW